MSVFAIGDTHLPGAANKPMDVFGGAWDNYIEKLKINWEKNVSDTDTVVIAGDVSWGMSFEEALCDFELLARLPGRKVIVKGNHDYWWDTVSKMTRILNKRGICNFEFIYNSCVSVENYALCATRGWCEKKSEQDDKIIMREAGRLERSLMCAPNGLEKVVFMHYPPVFDGGCIEEFVSVMQKYGVKRCFYGHLHAASIKNAVRGTHFGIEFFLVSADAIDFLPLKI